MALGEATGRPRSALDTIVAATAIATIAWWSPTTSGTSPTSSTSILYVVPSDDDRHRSRALGSDSLARFPSEGQRMKLGLLGGYSGRKISIPIDQVRHAESLGYDSFWTSEAYGSDAVSPAAWIPGADREAPRRHRHHADAGPLPRHDRHDGDDAGRTLGRPLHARPRRIRPAGRRRLARGPVRQAGHAAARVHQDRQADHRPRGAVHVRGRPVPVALRRPWRDRPRQAAEEHPALRGGRSDLRRQHHAARVAAAAEVADGFFPIWMDPENDTVFEESISQGLAAGTAPAPSSTSPRS